MNVLPFFTELLLKGTLVLVAAAGLVFLLQRSSAARRYAVWFSALVGLLLLPLLTFTLPGLQVVPRAGLLDSLPAHPAWEDGAASPSSPSLTTGSSAEVRPFATSAERAEISGTDRSTRASAADGSVSIHGSPEILASPENVSADPADSEPALAHPGMTPRQLLTRFLPWLWLSGALLAASPMLLGFLGIRRLAARARLVERGRVMQMLSALQRDLGIRSQVRLLIGPRGAMPMTWGTGLFSPATLLLPAEINGWSDERLRAVLLHELAHIRRRDCFTQSLARCACACYWFHPLAWLAGSRMLIERERACDDIVLRHSPSPSAYARDLIEVATRANPTLPAARAAIAMARPSRIDTRLRAILDPRRNRAGLSRRLIAGLAVFFALVALPVASLQWAATTDADSAEGEVILAEETERRQMELRLVDAVTGSQIPGTRVWASNPEGLGSMEVDPGRWMIDLPDERSYFIVQVEAPGYVRMWLLWNNLQLENPLPENHVLELERGSTIGGIIVDDAGEPVSRATVIVRFEPETLDGIARLSRPELETGEDGRWTFDAASRHFDEAIITVFHPNYASHSVGNGRPISSRHEPVAELFDGTAQRVLSRGIRVEGTVLTAEGEPARQARIGLGDSFFITQDRPYYFTDAEGRFRLPVHPNEEVTLSIRYPDHPPGLLRFHSSEQRENLLIQLESPQTITGQVVDENGPIPFARVSFFRWRNITSIHRMQADDQGRFAWDLAPSDEVLATISAEGYTVLRDYPVQAGEENLIRLSPIPTIQGMVVDAETGEAIPEFRLARSLAYRADTEPMTPTSWEEDEARMLHFRDGVFAFTPDAMYRRHAYRVIAPGYRMAESELFDLDDGDQTLLFELERAEWVAGRVLTPSGRAAANARLHLTMGRGSLEFVDGRLNHSRPTATEGKTASDGSFQFPPVDEPFFLLVLHDEGYAEVPWDNFPDTGEIRLQAWSRVTGTAHIRGSVAPNHEIAARYTRASGTDTPYISYEVRTFSDASGLFSFDRLPAGDVMISRATRDRASLFIRRTAFDTRTWLETASGEVTTVQLGGEGRPLTGRISLAGLEGIPWVAPTSYIAPAGLTRNEAVRVRRDLIVQPDGSFRLEELEPGDYLLTIDFQDDPQHGHQTLGRVTQPFTMPDYSGRYSDEPLELPVLPIQLTEQAASRN